MLDPADAAANVRAVIEAQAMAMALHSRWMGVDIDTIHATGGAAVNREILGVIADVFDADVYQLSLGNSAALGAALRAYHGDAVSRGDPLTWEQVIIGFAEPVQASRIRPRPENVGVYARMIKDYAECEKRSSVE